MSPEETPSTRASLRRHDPAHTINLRIDDRDTCCTFVHHVPSDSVKPIVRLYLVSC